MPTAAEIFQAMPSKFNAQAAGNWETVIQFNVSGEGGGTWTLEVKGGKCEVREGPATGPKATVNTDAATWVGINTGAVNGMQAFMTGKLKVQGNMGELMKLNNPAVFKK
jgi:putative sterol carrier protein